MSAEVAVTLSDILLAIDKVLSSIKSLEKTTGNLQIGCSNNSDVVSAITSSTDTITSQLIDINIHLGNIEAICRLLLQFLIVIVVFKSLYFIFDKVFFNGC